MKTFHPQHNASKSAGFTLIEVLIAVLVLSIGLLGLASLQTLSLQSNHSAYMRSQATLLAYDIIDRMRVNRGRALLGDYLINFDDAPNSGANCEASTCDETAMAKFDTSQWKCRLGKWNSSNSCSALNISGTLPEGDGEIIQNNDLFTVAVRYEERDGNTISLQITARI